MQDNEAIQAIQYQRGSMSILDQLKLPDETNYIPIANVADAWKAIHTMSIRGSSDSEREIFEYLTQTESTAFFLLFKVHPPSLCVAF